jgi:hypothetical protein
MAFAILFAVQVGSASAGSVVAKVDVWDQLMRVYDNGKLIHTWKESTARRSKVTPRATYSAKALSRHHKSSLYNNAPMPHSILLRGGITRSTAPIKLVSWVDLHLWDLSGYIQVMQPNFLR